MKETLLLRQIKVFLLQILIIYFLVLQTVGEETGMAIWTLCKCTKQPYQLLKLKHSTMHLRGDSNGNWT